MLAQKLFEATWNSCFTASPNPSHSKCSETFPSMLVSTSDQGLTQPYGHSYLLNNHGPWSDHDHDHDPLRLQSEFLLSGDMMWHHYGSLVCFTPPDLLKSTWLKKKPGKAEDGAAKQETWKKEKKGKTERIKKLKGSPGLAPLALWGFWGLFSVKTCKTRPSFCCCLGTKCFSMTLN